MIHPEDHRIETYPDLVNYEAEQALLAAVLTNNETYFRVNTFVRPEHFADALHGRIYAAAGRLIERGELANALTLKNMFEHDPALTEAGGARYLIRLQAGVVTLVGVEDYGRTIVDLAQRRQCLETAEALRQKVLDFEATSEEIINHAIGEMHKLSKAGPQSAKSKRAVAEMVVGEMTNPRPCYRTGLAALDEALGGGLFVGKMIGVAARKKVGKTVLAGTISHNLNLDGVRHLFIALEMSPAEIEQRAMARQLGVNAIAFLKRDMPSLPHRAAEYAVRIPDYTLYEGAPGATIDEIRRMIARAKMQHGITGVILDYLQLVGGRSRHETEEQHTRNVAQWLADTCRKEGIWALVLAQLNQEGNTRGGEGLRLACDCYFTLNRDEQDPTHYWMEMQDSRYVPYRNIGAAPPGLPGLVMHPNGPWFETTAYD